MALERYEDQVRLLVRTLPAISEETCFALKGGTAINLFYRDLPRVSVDIDLTYLPVQDRVESLKHIDLALDRIRARIESIIPGAQAQRIAGGGGGDTRMRVRLKTAEIKIETSPVMRGVVNEPETRSVTATVEDRFGFAEAQIASFEDVFGGKLHAALDRQHPRDLYDVKILYENEGLSDLLFNTFLVYIASSGRPPHEVLRPTLLPLDESYVKEFEGMTNVTVPLADLATARSTLISDIRARMTTSTQAFLLSLHDAQPDFNLIGLPHAADLPAVKWKLQNLAKLKRENPEKHAAQRAALMVIWDK